MRWRLLVVVGGCVCPIQNVTNQDHVKRVMTRIEAENPKGLWALVNNAGICAGGYVDWLGVDVYRQVMEVNFFSMISVTQAALPLIKKSKGRIVNMTSLSGLVPGIQRLSTYSSSKHAAEVWTSCLRNEMLMWDVTVCSIAPSIHNTPMNDYFESTMNKAFSSMPLEKQEAYGTEFLKNAIENTKFFNEGCWDPKNVVYSMAHAATALKPRPQYLVGMDARFLAQSFIFMPSETWTNIASVVYGDKLPKQPQRIANNAERSA